MFVNNPGDFSDKERLELMNNMVGEFENITGSWGPVGTMYFVRDFMQFETALKCTFDKKANLNRNMF